MLENINDVVIIEEYTQFDVINTLVKFLANSKDKYELDEKEPMTFTIGFYRIKLKKILPKNSTNKNQEPQPVKSRSNETSVNNKDAKETEVLV